MDTVIKFHQRGMSQPQQVELKIESHDQVKLPFDSGPELKAPMPKLREACLHGKHHCGSELYGFRVFIVSGAEQRLESITRNYDTSSASIPMKVSVACLFFSLRTSMDRT